MSQLEGPLGYEEDTSRDIILPLSHLQLDEQNFRIDEVDNQQDAIFAVLRHQREGEKIHNLAEDIVKRGRLAPGDRLYVIADDGQADEPGQFIVMEGNRRITALKLLQNPHILEGSDFPKLYQQFAALSQRMPERLKWLLDNIPCVLFPDRDSALGWVELRHSTNLDGIGLEKWDARATTRFNALRGRFRRWRIALKRLADAEVNTSEIERGIARKTSAVDRVLGTRVVRDTLGLVFQETRDTVEFENGNESAGIELLLHLMEAMADADFTTATVHAKKDRIDFVLSFQEYAVKATRTDRQDGTKADRQEDQVYQRGAAPRGGEAAQHDPAGRRTPSGQAQEQAQKTEKGPDTAKAPGTGKLPLRSRKTLAPTGLHKNFHVKNAGLNKLYKELRDLPVKGFEKSAGVLTRVFLELTCDAYLEHQGVPLPDHFARRNITKWADAKLREKLEAALKDFDPGRKDAALAPVWKALGGDDWLHSIDTLHAFVHSPLTVTDAEVKMIWDRYQPFFQGLHNRISND